MSLMKVRIAKILIVQRNVTDQNYGVTIKNCRSEEGLKNF